MRGFKLTVRQAGTRVRSSHYDALAVAIDALELELRAIDAERDTLPWIGKDIEPARQVVVRGEISGPKIKAGVDLRGDGSRQAFIGRVMRAPIEQRDGESAFDALRRLLDAQ